MLQFFRTYMKFKQNIWYYEQGGLSPDHIGSLIGGSVSESPRGSLSVDTVGLPIEFLYPSGPYSFLLLFLKGPHVLPTIWLSVSVTVWDSGWVEPLSGQNELVFKYNIVPITCNIDDWCLPKRWVSTWTSYWLAIPSVSAPSFMPVFLVGRINLELKVLWEDWCLLLHWGSCLAIVGGLFRFNIFTILR